MGQKPKTRGSPKKAAKPKAKDEKQFERFIETARTLEVHESEEHLERAFKAIASATSKVSGS